MTPQQFLALYEQATNTHDFDRVDPLIADDAIFWFSDKSLRGKNSVRAAFEQTWAAIRNETYQITEVEWLVEDKQSATAIYTFVWRGEINGKMASGQGRGTSVLKNSNGAWKVVHEHLSPKPCSLG